MPPDFLGVDKQQEQPPQQTTDFLGAKVPIAFSSQPSLPAAGPGAGAGGGASAAPPTIAGSGVAAPTAASVESGFADLAKAFQSQTGGGGNEGPGAPGVEQGPNVGLGLTQDVGPTSLSLSPFGQLSLNANTGNKTLDTGVNTVGKTLLGQLGVPTSTNLVSLVGRVLSSPVLSTVGSALSLVGLPFTFINVVDFLAHMMENSVVNVQGRNANMDTLELEAMTPEALAQAAYGALGPKVGGAQPIGSLPTDAPLTGPQGLTFGLDFSNPSVRSGFEAQQAFNQAQRGREDAPGVAPTAPVSDPVAEGFTAAEAAAATSTSPTADAPAAADSGTSPDW